MNPTRHVTLLSRRTFAGLALAAASSGPVLATPRRRSPVRVLAFGASNTWGFLPVDPVERRLRRLPSAQAWPGVCQRILGSRYEILTDSLPGRTVGADRPDMAGRFVGAAAYNGMKELPEAIARTAPLDVVVVQLGANDLLSDKALTPEELVARFVAMAELIASFRFPVPLADMAVPIRALILSPPAFAEQPNNPAWAADEARRARMPALLRAAGAQHGFAVADAAEAVPVPGSDGLHFGAEAHARLGRLVAGALRTMAAAPPSATP